MERAAAIWMILLLAVAVVTVALALPKKPPAAVRPRLELVPALEPDDDPIRTQDDLRYAEEVAVAADRAAATAGRRRDEWATAQDEVDQAWTAYQAADAEARRTAAAAAYPVMRRRRVVGQNADRERYLHRSAIALCRNREISIGQLNDILAHRGWNPRLDPAAQESALRAAVRDHRYAAYLAAGERERQAWETAERAAAALASLRAEACAATLRTAVDDRTTDAGWWAEQWTTAEPVRAAAA
jgi:hypothetical protein